MIPPVEMPSTPLSRDFMVGDCASSSSLFRLDRALALRTDRGFPMELSSIDGDMSGVGEDREIASWGVLAVDRDVVETVLGDGGVFLGTMALACLPAEWVGLISIGAGSVGACVLTCRECCAWFCRVLETCDTCIFPS